MQTAQRVRGHGGGLDGTHFYPQILFCNVNYHK